MSRDNSDLYTGITSNSISAAKKPSPEKLERQRIKQEQRIKLKPAAEVVLEAINNERNKVTNLKSMMSEKSLSPEDLAIEFKARYLYMSYLNSLEALVKKSLETS